MPELTAKSVSKRLRQNDEDLLLVDIRHEEAVEQWHIPGSRNIDVYDELKSNPDLAAAELRNLPEDREIVTVCAAGVRSAVATEFG